MFRVFTDKDTSTGDCTAGNQQVKILYHVSFGNQSGFFFSKHFQPRTYWNHFKNGCQFLDCSLRHIVPLLERKFLPSQEFSFGDVRNTAIIKTPLLNSFCDLILASEPVNTDIGVQQVFHSSFKEFLVLKLYNSVQPSASSGHIPLKS